MCDDYHHISGVKIGTDEPEWLQAYYLGAHNTQRELKDRVLYALREEASDRWTRDIIADEGTEETITDHDRMIAVHETLCTLMQQTIGEGAKESIKNIAGLMHMYGMLSKDSPTPEDILDDTKDVTPKTVSME